MPLLTAATLKERLWLSPDMSELEGNVLSGPLDAAEKKVKALIGETAYNAAVTAQTESVIYACALLAAWFGMAVFGLRIRAYGLITTEQSEGESGRAIHYATAIELARIRALHWITAMQVLDLDILSYPEPLGRTAIRSSVVQRVVVF